MLVYRKVGTRPETIYAYIHQRMSVSVHTLTGDYIKPKEKEEGIEVIPDTEVFLIWYF